MDELLSIFPTQPPKGNIHIIVKVPPTGELERISQPGVADEILTLKPCHADSCFRNL